MCGLLKLIFIQSKIHFQSTVIHSETDAGGLTVKRTVLTLRLYCPRTEYTVVNKYQLYQGSKLESKIKADRKTHIRLLRADTTFSARGGTGQTPVGDRPSPPADARVKRRDLSSYG